MKIYKYIKWAIKIILFILILVLILDNLQTVKLSIFNVYILQLPLIIVLLLFLIIGIIIGLLINIIKIIELKAKIFKINKNNEYKILDKSNN